MKAYKVLALLKKVEKLNAGDKRVLINGFPCKVDFRVIADDLFEDVVYALEETIEELERVKNYSIPDVVGRSEQFYCTCSRAKGLDYDEEGTAYCISCQKVVQ